MKAINCCYQHQWKEKKIDPDSDLFIAFQIDIYPAEFKKKNSAEERGDYKKKRIVRDPGATAGIHLEPSVKGSGYSKLGQPFPGNIAIIPVFLQPPAYHCNCNKGHTADKIYIIGVMM